MRQIFLSLALVMANEDYKGVVIQNGQKIIR